MKLQAALRLEFHRKSSRPRLSDYLKVPHVANRYQRYGVVIRSRMMIYEKLICMIHYVASTLLHDFHLSFQTQTAGKIPRFLTICQHCTYEYWTIQYTSRPEPLLIPVQKFNRISVNHKTDYKIHGINFPLPLDMVFPGVYLAFGT